MTGLLKIIDTPTLPYDVLRLVFEEATRDDKRKAVKYALTSKLVCTWIESCLYSDVQLYSGRSLHNFLRTLQSSTKSKMFFATRVKSLAIAYDAQDFEWTARILRACSGVKILTMWAISSCRTPEVPSTTNVHIPARSCRIPYHMPLSVRPVHHCHDSLYETFASHLRPKHLAVLLDKPLYIHGMHNPSQPGLAPSMTPDFSLGIFSSLTHLSIVNRWTEWSTWVWSWSTASSTGGTLGLATSLKFLPRLTHLSLDIQVGKPLMTKELVHSSTVASPHFQRSQKLAEHLGMPLATILTSPELNPQLRVLLCIISFDANPHSTSQMIWEKTSHHVSILLSERQLHSFRNPHSGKNHSDSGLGDLRLVFAYDREPFKGREAGSSKVWGMWERAEEISRLQRRSDVVATYG
ncbi:hypothetical protein AN958_01760 [Leucoagaricus sp. SymC.cos]|nr:hypothetical protein AN958_01760 [Leucoagaricus sp. SymC.cos]